MKPKNWTLNPRVVLSLEEERFVAFQLETGMAYEFDRAFFIWFDQLGDSFSRDELIETFHPGSDNKDIFFNWLLESKLLIPSDQFPIHTLSPLQYSGDLGTAFRTIEQTNLNNESNHYGVVMALNPVSSTTPPC